MLANIEESCCRESIFFLWLFFLLGFSTCSEMSNNSATKEEQDQVLSFLDHVLANEDDERLPDTHGHTLQQHTNSITNKKDSGYGSQGHLKLEVRDEPSSITFLCAGLNVFQQQGKNFFDSHERKDSIIKAKIIETTARCQLR